MPAPLRVRCRLDQAVVASAHSGRPGCGGFRRRRQGGLRGLCPVGQGEAGALLRRALWRPVRRRLRDDAGRHSLQGAGSGAAPAQRTGDVPGRLTRRRRGLPHAAKVLDPSGGTCHFDKGRKCQKGRSVAQSQEQFTLQALADRVKARAQASADESYTRKLLDRGIAHCAKKLGEEAIETAIAAIAEDRERVIAETADLLYHLLVVLEARGITLAEVENALMERTAKTGLEEKASRPRD